MTVTCTKCKVARPLDRFNVKRSGDDPTNLNNLRMPCKDCGSARRKAEGEARLIKEREWSRKARSSNPRKKRNKYLWDTHKITIEQYEEMLESQGGVCAICLGPSVNEGNFSVDHDHDCCPGSTSCGKCVRALLCGHCNRGLGLFNDNRGLLEAASQYLGKFQSTYHCISCGYTVTISNIWSIRGILACPNPGCANDELTEEK